MADSYYKNLEIREKDFGAIEIFLDGEPVKGCTEASLYLTVGEVPHLKLDLLVINADVTLGENSVEGAN